MREAITAGDANRIQRTAHNLKGEIGLFGATIAYNLAAALETLGREAQLDKAPHVLQKLGRELERVASFLSQSGWENCV
jgi:HPt (histidine-containing phosphotransfer) domain-containing protein